MSAEEEPAMAAATSQDKGKGKGKGAPRPAPKPKPKPKPEEAPQKGGFQPLEGAGELSDDPKAMHGFLGDPGWAAPLLAAQCDKIARPGYESAAANEYLDAEDVLSQKVAILAGLIEKAKRFVIYAGAGLSTGAGISDYATRAGAASVVGQTNAAEKPKTGIEAQPSRGHLVIAAMAQRGLLYRFVQQNHDGLPQKAGVPQEVMNEIHGGWFDPSNPVIKMQGYLRNDLSNDLDLCVKQADLCLVLGSSLCGMSADRIVAKCARRAEKSPGMEFGSVIVSLQTTPYDEVSSVRLFATIDHVMELLAKELALDVSLAGPQYPRVEPIHRPLGADVDVFSVPYDEEGYLTKDGSRRLWDLRVRANSRILNEGGFAKRETVILSKSDDGHYRLGIKDPRMVQGDWHESKYLGSWWIECAVEGRVPWIPIVPVASAE